MRGEIHAPEEGDSAEVGKFIFFRRAWKRGSERRGSKPATKQMLLPSGLYRQNGGIGGRFHFPASSRSILLSIVVVLFVAFEMGRENLGDQQARLPMAKLRVLWNSRLNPNRTSILATFGHTGNYLIRSEPGLGRLASELGSALGRRFAVFSARAISEVVADAARTRAPRGSPGLRLTPSLVMNLKSQGQIPPKLENTSRAVSYALA